MDSVAISEGKGLHPDKHVCYVCAPARGRFHRLTTVARSSLQSDPFLSVFQAWVVERMGRFHRILDPGLNILVPVADKIKYVQSLKEIAIDVPKQSAITSDNVTLSIDGVLYLRIIDPYKGRSPQSISSGTSPHLLYHR